MLWKLAGAAVLALGILVGTGSSAEARDGCGPGFHRNFYGFCRPNFYGPVFYRPVFYGPPWRRPWGWHRARFYRPYWDRPWGYHGVGFDRPWRWHYHGWHHRW
ncbi:hypothetical protein PUR21_06080 [Methylorubrum rhodesianum]|jgi:hypothetical protein|nr:hypothetical protein [Methylorubrum extorquens]MRI57613.1 hypothetical protein [Methylobacterium sp. DB1607]